MKEKEMVTESVLEEYFKVTEIEQLNIRKTEEKNGRGIYLLQDHFNHLLSGYSIIGEKVKIIDGKSKARIQLINKCCHLSKCVIDLSQKGYYDACFILLRSFLEATVWLRAIEKPSLLKSLKKEEGQKIDRILQKVPIETREAYWRVFSLLSKTTHPKEISLNGMSKMEGNKLVQYIPQKFSINQFNSIANINRSLMNDVMLWMIRTYSGHLPTDYSEKLVSYVKEAQI